MLSWDDLLDIRNALRLANVLALSSARSRRTRGGIPRGWAKKPVANIYISVSFFLIAFVMVYSSLRGKLGDPTITLLVTQLLVFLPSFIAFMAMLYSLLYEFSEPSGAASSDMINWLPIGAGEYVVASALLTIYFISPMISIVFGGTFGLSILMGSMDLWALSVVFGLLGSVIGAFALESVRALMNKASETISRGKGQSAIILRMLFSITIILAVSLIFNVSVLLKVVEFFSGSLNNIWFVPLLWPSLAMLRYLSRDMIGVLGFTALSLILTLAAYYASVETRKRYWAPSPISFRINPIVITEKRGLLGAMGFNASEVALIKKDLKSLLRRREMATLLAMPIMFVLLGLLNTEIRLLLDRTVALKAKSQFFGQAIMGLMFLVYQLALMSVGQEGPALINLMAAPLDSKQLLRAKAATAILPSLTAFIAFIVFFIAVTESNALSILIIVIIGGSLIIEICFSILVVGIRYAIFSGGSRTRFVKYEGYLISMLVCMVVMGVTGSPLILHLLKGQPNFSIAIILMETLSVGIGYLAHRAAYSEIQKLWTLEI